MIPLYTLTAGKGFAVVADEIDGINIAVDESAQGVTVAAQSTSELVDALSTIKAEADIRIRRFPNSFRKKLRDLRIFSYIKFK